MSRCAMLVQWTVGERDWHRNGILHSDAAWTVLLREAVENLDYEHAESLMFCVRFLLTPEFASDIDAATAHLPRWYKPFECTDCGQSFYRQGSLTRHLKVSLPRYLCPKRRAGLDADSRKRRKLAPVDSSGDESPADDMIVETECVMPSSSSLRLISSAQSISSSPRPPSPLTHSDYDDQNLASGDAHADNTDSALHERRDLITMKLRSAEKLIREMQAEIGALRDVVQVHRPAASPVSGAEGASDWGSGEDGDWSLDGFATNSPCSLKGHIATQHIDVEPKIEDDDTACGLVCLWVRCGSTFSNDRAGADDLWVHLKDEHLLAVGPVPIYQCQWDKCTRAFQRSFEPHLRSHLPKWYRPYECTIVLDGLHVDKTPEA
ncbi:hypothetical protein AURDEDRAFT_166341 [Auricularia subglabra TFB-10046 SS5]|uniref:C2H2-type domain-containing protein n=1 Tax=Auricularia subglabra (strain TFB-10046 / SS5) TaxID=717982 RepID=J0D344_AURST|nr:hypothetical protein AURDEDRAFT_166341 [Auricularia subglabra TFB-10046 SS5]